MTSCFLSHSSKDKKNYIQIVANLLPNQWRTYDSDTFESGMRTLDEILRTLEESSLFVLFISDSALESDWVKKEILEAKHFEDIGKIKRIYPLIIDKNITHDDPRIPDWLRDNYNLRTVTRPGAAARRIAQRLRELSWDNHPRLSERQKIFVGRNIQISEFEERFDDYTLQPPTCAICSGLPVVGRKTLLKRALMKVGLIRDSYDPPEILLTAQESIEDFIIKLYDLGLSEKEDLNNLMLLTLERKIEIAARLCRDIANQNEILLIEDNGCLINHERVLARWFEALLGHLYANKKTVLAIASRFRVSTRRNDIFYTAVPELNKVERMGLFKRVAEFEGLNLTADDYSYFEELLFGFPDQVFYVVALIKDYGLPAVKKKTELLVEFNSDRAMKLVELNAPNLSDKEFLYLLSEFDFISYEFLDTLAEPSKYQGIIERFLASAMCETLGANREYIRLNDSIRDYMRRTRMSLPEEFESKLKQHVEIFLQSQDSKEIDASDYLFSIRRALSDGQKIDTKLLIPSHFLKAMKDLYDNSRKYAEIVTLADRVLESEAYMDANITTEIRYFLCLSLARLKDKRFLREVEYVRSYEHNFLLGFYYRICGKTKNAIDYQLKAIQESRTASRARRELVQLYVTQEDFKSAISLAEQSYEERPSNPYHIQAYLTCLINLENWKDYDTRINKLLNDLNIAKSRSERTEEMYSNALAQYQAYCLGNYELGLQTIEDTILKFPDNLYPVFTKLSIMFRQRCLSSKIEETLVELEKKIQHGSQFKDVLERLKSRLNQYKTQEKSNW